MGWLERWNTSQSEQDGEENWEEDREGVHEASTGEY
jgi:hypothetical protein